MLVNLHAQPVALLPDVGGQIKVGRREAILGIAHKVPVEPHIEGPLHPLKADADGFAQQAGFQIKVRSQRGTLGRSQSISGGRISERPSHGYRVLMYWI